MNTTSTSKVGDAAFGPNVSRDDSLKRRPTPRRSVTVSPTQPVKSWRPKPWQVRQRRLAERVTELRGGRTKTAFAGQCGITVGVLSRVESGTQLIPAAVAEKIDAWCCTGGELARTRRGVLDLKGQLPDCPPKKPAPPAAGASTGTRQRVLAAVGRSLDGALRSVDAVSEAVGDPDSPFTAVQVSLYRDRCRAFVAELRGLAGVVAPLRAGTAAAGGDEEEDPE